MNSKISDRYILLEDEGHWECLKEIVDVPMHLIHVETWSDQEYVIIESTGISALVQQYLVKEHHSKEASVPEDEFVRNLVASDKTIGICICDEPGMGKSWLLANIAQKLLQTSETLRVGCFVSIAPYMNKLLEENVNDEEAIRSLLSHSRASALSIEIIWYLLQNTGLQLECFFDGYDEISLSQHDSANNLLKTLNQRTNIRVFVTARPHMRLHLEGLIGTTAYDIIPFTTSQQREYLTAHWQEKLPKPGVKCTSNDINKVKQFAESLIQSFPSLKSKDGVGGLGVPLKCFLLAEVYEQYAIRYAKLQSVQLESIITHTHSSSTTALFSKYLELGLAKSTKTASDQGFKELLVSLHTHKALALFFPHLKYTVAKLDPEKVDDFDLLAVGFLQKTNSGFEFFHRMFAEFLVAKHFAKHLCENQWEAALVKTFFTDVLRYHDKEELFNDKLWWPYISRMPSLHIVTLPEDIVDFDFDEIIKNGRKNINSVPTESSMSFEFNNSTLLEFLNAILENDCGCTKTMGSVSNNVFEVVEDTVLFRILLSSTRKNLYNLLRHLFRLIEINPVMFEKAKNIFVRDNMKRGASFCCWHLIYSASLYAGKVISMQVTNFLLETMKTGNIFENMPDDFKTPLHAAVQIGDYNCAEYFQNYITLHGRCLLYYVLEDSIDDPTDVIKSKDEIIRMLVSKDNTLLNEERVRHYSEFKMTGRDSGPIYVEKIHFELIKVMVELGANVSVAGNVLSNAAMNASCQEEFSDLLSFLNEKLECSVMNEFLEADYFTKPTLQRSSEYWFEFPRKLIERLLQTPGFDMNQHDVSGIQLIHFSHYPDLTQLLISHGADINAISKEFVIDEILRGPRRFSELCKTYNRLNGHKVVQKDTTFTLRKNVAHSVSKRCTDPEQYFKWTTYMMNAGYSRLWEAEDIEGITPLEYAIMGGDVKKECIELIISKTGLCINARRTGRRSLVQVAAEHGTVDTLKALTALGADWKQLDTEGRSTLHLTVIGGRFETVEYILGQGVSVSAADHTGKTPIHGIASHFNAEMLTDLLLDHGADLCAKDSNGNTVAHNLNWPENSYRMWKQSVVGMGKGDLFQIRNNDNLFPDDVKRPNKYHNFLEM